LLWDGLDWALERNVLLRGIWEVFSFPSIYVLYDLFFPPFVEAQDLGVRWRRCCRYTLRLWYIFYSALLNLVQVTQSQRLKWNYILLVLPMY